MIYQVPYSASTMAGELLVGFAGSSHCWVEHPIASHPVPVAQMHPPLPASQSPLGSESGRGVDLLSPPFPLGGCLIYLFSLISSS